MRRLFGLQYLRGVAALGVVAYHAADRAGARFTPGEAGVDLFFVLSGFLMWAITDASSGPLPFLADRIKRIVPSYWIATTVFLIGALAGLFPAVRLTIGHVAASYLFIPSVSPSNGQIWPLLVPGWTLNYEMGFYLVFGLALCLPRAVQLGVISVVLLGFGTTHIWIRPGDAILFFYGDPHILEFLAGTWLAWSWQAGWPRGRKAGLLLALLGFAAVASCFALPADWPKAARYGLPALLLVAAVLAFEGADAVPELKALRSLGDASYSIYLWHTLALSVSAKAAVALHLSPGIALAIHLLVGTGAGLIAYALVERPLLNAFRRRRYRHGAPVPSGV
jgi:exopolysaccharide production protein ExoZ